MEAGLAEATKIITEKRPDLETLAKGLLEYETLTGEEIEQLLKGHHSVLRIGILQSLSSRHVSKLLGSFRCDNPFVAIEMFDGVGEQLIGLLTDRRVDAILTIFDDDSATKFPGRVLFDEPYVLAVPKHIASRSEKA